MYRTEKLHNTRGVLIYHVIWVKIFIIFQSASGHILTCLDKILSLKLVNYVSISSITQYLYLSAVDYLSLSCPGQPTTAGALHGKQPVCKYIVHQATLYPVLDHHLEELKTIKIPLATTYITQPTLQINSTSIQYKKLYLFYTVHLSLQTITCLTY